MSKINIAIVSKTRFDEFENIRELMDRNPTAILTKSNKRLLNNEITYYFYLDSESEKMRGVSFDFAVIDEYSHLDDLMINSILGPSLYINKGKLFKSRT